MGCGSSNSNSRSLYEACRDGTSVQAVEDFIARGASVNYKDKDEVMLFLKYKIYIYIHAPTVSRVIYREVLLLSTMRFIFQKISWRCS
jgi:hypothetical protein